MPANIRKIRFVVAHHRVRVVGAKDHNINWRCMIGHAETNTIRTILNIVESNDGR